jgi:hypothetical protein
MNLVLKGFRFDGGSLTGSELVESFVLSCEGLLAAAAVSSVRWVAPVPANGAVFWLGTGSSFEAAPF